MMGMFLVWLVATAVEVWKQRSATEKVLGDIEVVGCSLCIAGLAFLVAAGNLIVTGARGVAISFA